MTRRKVLTWILLDAFTILPDSLLKSVSGEHRGNGQGDQIKFNGGEKGDKPTILLHILLNPSPEKTFYRNYPGCCPRAVNGRYMYCLSVLLTLSLAA